MTPSSTPQLVTSNLFVPQRRGLLKGVGMLSAGAVMMLAGVPSRAQAMDANSESDAHILNVALALEYEAINAYQLGAESGLLQKPVLALAVRFQSDHKAHRDVLESTIRKLGGTPAPALTLQEYAKALDAAKLKSQNDVLDLAARLELGATNAYLGVIPAFKDTQLAKVAGRVACDETLHWTLLNNALGRPLPASALSFGA
ncbi:MAG: ferritin [Comamonas sp. SCN 65-56]|uniref:ferritin-like domain-containing protein n=1 Tax=Comamonas sp. SCN 65-56 TaxID=1660095 RepID=UPI0008693972|nr:ferritin-like domain-containing protein [Comamonas sp. SCN 65-56]ODS93600.1 MAG: ferritin [Comamonas sp. SCN 65-56]